MVVECVLDDVEPMECLLLPANGKLGDDELGNFELEIGVSLAVFLERVEPTLKFRNRKNKK